ncbi:putative cytochrome P450 family protein [Aspergillus aurantiobrunneus]
MRIFEVLALGILAALTCHGICASLQRRRLDALSKKHGCAAPATKSMRWPWGAERIYKLLCFKGDLLDDLVTPSFAKLQSWTLQLNMPLVLKPSLLVADPANVKAVLSTSFADWGVGPRRLKQFGPFLGLGIFTADGHAWSSSRSLLRPVFTRHQVGDIQFTARHVDRLLQCLGRESAQGARWTDWVDAMPFIYRFTLDAATEFLFGDSVESQVLPSNALAAELLGRNNFERAFEASSLGVGGRMRLGAFYWLVNYPAFRNACRLCRTYVTGFVEKALSLKKHPQQQPLSEKAGPVRTQGLFLQQLAEFTDDPVLIRDQLLQLLFAGRDTTATLISFALLCLARHPGGWDKLREEILQQFGTPGDVGRRDEMTFENLKGCTYLQHVLSETLRLYPPIPVNTRQALRDTVLPTGGGPDRNEPVVVPQGTTLTYSVYVIHRRKDIWGEDASEWRPERWEGMKGGFHYLPFNAGPRHCPGQQFALTEAAYTLARLAQTFDRLECPDPEEPVRKTLGITIQPAEGVVSMPSSMADGD